MHHFNNINNYVQKVHARNISGIAKYRQLYCYYSTCAGAQNDVFKRKFDICINQ